jgi:thiosulfate reductase cytochrome b subunit
MYDLRIRKTLPPKMKYNGAQRIAYTAVIIMGALMVLTGFAIYKPVQLNWLCALLGGYAWARAEHFILTILFCLFFLVHVVQAIRSGWNNFRSMITGFEVFPVEEDNKPVHIEKTNLPS